MQLDGGFKCNLQALVESVEVGGKSPVSALNELGVRVYYRVIGKSGPAHFPIFTVAVTVADMTFKGCGNRKREAKASAARTCLRALLARAGSNPEPEPDFIMDELPPYPVSKFQCIEAKIQPPEVNDKTASTPPPENYLDSQEINATSEVVQCSQAITSEQNKYDKAALAEHIKRKRDFWWFAFPYESPPVTYIYGLIRSGERRRRRASHRSRPCRRSRPIDGWAH